MSERPITDDRIIQLERQVRQLRALVGLVLAAVVCVVSSAVIPNSLYEVRTNRLVLQDDDGIQRGVWKVENGAVSLQMFDDQSRPRVNLSSDGSGNSTVTLLDWSGEEVLSLSEVNDQPLIRCWTAQNGPQIALGIMNGVPGIDLADDQGNAQVKLRAGGQTPQLSVTDGLSLKGMQVFAAPDRSGWSVFDAEGQIRLAGLNLNNENPALILQSKTARNLMTAETSSRGSPDPQPLQESKAVKSPPEAAYPPPRMRAN